MAGPPIIVSRRAEQDLIDIWEYVAGEGSVATADRLLGRITALIEKLAESPRSGRVRPEFRGRPRSFAMRPYVIFYTPVGRGTGIHVWRVLHGVRRLGGLVRPPKS